MLRPVMFALVVSLAVLGVAAAKPIPMDSPIPTHVPKKFPQQPALDAVWSSQLKAVQKGQVLPPAPAVDKFPELAGVRRMNLADKAAALQTTTDAVSGGTHLSVRTPYIDDGTYLEFIGTTDQMTVSPAINRAHFANSGAPTNWAKVAVTFRTEANRRHLVECVVVGRDENPQTITAADPDATYSVQTGERATVLYLSNPRPTAGSRTVILTGQKSWAFESCEITSA